MSIKVYVVTDKNAIGFIMDEDIDGFRDYLSEEEFLCFGEPEIFFTEKEALAFCAAFGKGIDERADIEKLPLRSSERSYIPFINAIENR